MSSNLKVNTILPSTGTTVAVSGIASVTSSVSIASSCTATTFYGSGANLTSLPAQATIANNADNRVITGGSGVNLNAESGLTYDGSTLAATGAITATGTIETTGNELKITGAEPRLTFTDTDNNPDFQLWANAQRFSIYDSTNSATRLRITSGGQVRLGNTDITTSSAADDLIIGPNTPAGDHGITIISGTSGVGNIYFSDTDTTGVQNRMGTIAYYHNGNYMRFSTNGNQERLRIDSSGNLFLRSASANYLVMGSSGDATSGGVTNNMNWIRGNGANTQYNTSGGFHAFEISGTERFKIDANGYIYETAMPFGVLHGTTGWQYNNNGNGHYLLGNTSSSSGGGNGSDKQMNLGWTTSGGNGATNNNFTPSNGIWTAPIAGYYVFGIKLYGLMNGSDYIQIKPCLNGTHLSETIYGYQQGNGMYMEGINETVRYYMEANDTFSWNAYGPNNAWRIYGAHCETSGYLVRGA